MSSEPSEATGAVPKKPKTVRKRTCCVSGCTPKTAVSPYFNVPSGGRNAEQRDLFLKVINRVNPDGSPWDPKSNTAEICSRHFVSGKPR